MGHRTQILSIGGFAALFLAACGAADNDDQAALDELEQQAAVDQERLDLIEDRLGHFHEHSAVNGVLVSPLLGQGSGDLPDFDFDLNEGYVLDVYCIGEVSMEVRINGEPAGSSMTDCHGGHMSMARDAPDLDASESNISIHVEDENSYWLAGVTGPRSHQDDGE